MRTVLIALLPLTLSGWLLPASVYAGPPEDFCPDPRSVQRHGPAYRYPQSGWIVLHTEGKPYDRGYQHGRLLAIEIAGYLRCFAALQSPKAPTEGWRNTRLLVNALFVRRFEKEYLEEMRGIADGASAAGARFDDRPIDLVDIVGINCWPEVETLGAALEATPTGLEGIRFPHRQPRAPSPPKVSHCSAFAATGPATADGKVVFGHITMFSLYPSLFYNVWLDIKPEQGHRVLMQTYPGGIQSGMDYYLNDAGLIVCETTIGQTRFASDGMTLASRIRKALQYADSIDGAVAILEKDNNGLYTNEWLLADIKTNEIAMFELGTRRSKLYRSSKDEWFGGTPGFYWGCNNTKDLDVRLETVASVQGRPANVVWRPTDRDQAWLRLFEKHKGKIDVAFGKEAFTTPPLAAYHSLDAKFTTTTLARDLKTWALFGPPLGRSWQPTPEERGKFPEIRPMASNPWTILHPAASGKMEPGGPAVVDLTDKRDRAGDAATKRKDASALPTLPAWHGTLLPRADADMWLATAFADYERIVAQENALRDQAAADRVSSADRDQLAVRLFAHRSDYLAAARARGDVPLAKTRSQVTEDYWYRVAAGKGVLVLHELRQLLGDQTFQETMDAFGRAHAGKTVTSGQFEQWLQKKHPSRKLPEFFAYWLEQTGLPALRLGEVKTMAQGKKYRIEGELSIAGGMPRPVEVAIETPKGEVIQTVQPLPQGGSSSLPFSIETDGRPLRLIVDKYGGTAKANGGAFSVLSFLHEIEQTLIVYGTVNEADSNREAAVALQRAIIERHSNYTVPIKADRDVTEGERKNHHLLLIGRPDSNSLIERSQEALPVTFGSRSLVVRGEAYAHPGSAVVAAAENPWNNRYSLVLLTGLGADSTLSAPRTLLQWQQAAPEVLVLPNGAKPRALVIPARELVRELTDK